MSPPSVGERLSLGGGAEGGQADGGGDQCFQVVGPLQGFGLQLGEPEENVVQAGADGRPTPTVDDDRLPGEVAVEVRVEGAGLDRLRDPVEICTQEPLRDLFANDQRQRLPGRGVEVGAASAPVDPFDAASASTAVPFFEDFEISPSRQVPEAAGDMG